tara:strand:+ start:531 stop:707 length:177 start_codon:yes stop_codon:yes gene_type:complete
MDKPLLNMIETIDYDREWKKTLLYKFGKKYPSEAWKQQLNRIYKKKYIYKKKIYLYNK